MSESIAGTMAEKAPSDPKTGEDRDLYRNLRGINATETRQTLEALDSAGTVRLLRGRPATVRCTCSKQCRAAEGEE